MKKTIFIFLITTSLSFTNGLRFTMEKDKDNNLNKKNSRSEKEISEIGDADVKSFETNINTDVKLIDKKKNNKILLNNLLNKRIKYLFRNPVFVGWNYKKWN